MIPLCNMTLSILLSTRRKMRPPYHRLPFSQGVVLVTTIWPAIYAFDAVSGECLWKDTGTIKHGITYPLGPAILGTFIVVASGTSLYRWQIPSP